MEIIVDNHVINLLVQDSAKIDTNHSLSSLDNHIRFRWPSLLEYLGFGSLFSTLPTFDQSQPLFKTCISTLCENEQKDVIYHIYDQLFVENLNHIKALPQMSASVLLKTIKEQRDKPAFLKQEKLISTTLLTYETAFVENASHTLHDLILYLAWDRMCVWMRNLFNYQSTDSNFIRAIAVLKECLIESYQHITRQGRTAPSFYRMLESFFFYQMREENIQKHTDEEWVLLTQSFPVLKEQNELVDFFYIDDAVTSEDMLTKGQENTSCYLTLDSSGRVKTRIALAQYMMKKLKEEVPGWDYTLQPKKILYFQ